jgi:hypothetical protein
MGVTDENKETEKMTLEMAILLRRSVQTITYMMDSLPEKQDPVGRLALEKFSLTMAAELASYDFMTDGESHYVLKIVKEILPRA